MSENMPMRRAYDASCLWLQELGYLESGPIPPIPDRCPQCDDEEPLGVNFFRTFVGEGDLSNLTLPRTYFGKSEIGPLSIKNTDLSESNLCWNDFTGVDLTDSDLTRSDLRASNFTEVVFIRTNLRDADMRRSSFNDCDFTGADMRGVKLSREQGAGLSLLVTQRQEIDWQEGDGDEPPGG
jgi:hypothetical protein